MMLYTLHNLRQRYGQREVLHIPELAIGRGERLSIVGPSGAGKSTLLRLLALLELPSAGQLVFDGHAVPPLPPAELRRQVTLVFQRPALLQRSVRAVVRYGLQVRGRRDEQRLDDLLSALGLAPLADAPASTLSGGEAQRVALARALLIRPAALLLDEPTANLDPANVALIESLVLRESAELGMTVIVVTHNLFQARRLSTRTALLLGGKLVEVGPTEQLFTQPSDPRTAAFLSGEMVY